jgi:hypothetical protein
MLEFILKISGHGVVDYPGTRTPRLAASRSSRASVS